MNKHAWNFEIMILKRYLLQRGGYRNISEVSLLAVLGIAFGVMALLLSLFVIGGFHREYKKAILDFNSHLTAMQSGGFISDEVWHQDFEGLKEWEDVEGVAPFLYVEGMGIDKGRLRGVILKGIPFEDYRQHSHVHLPEVSEGLVLGKRLADELNLKVGDSLKIMIPEGRGDLLHNYFTFPIAGTFETGLYDYDTSFALLPLLSLQKILKVRGLISGVEIWMKDPEQSLLFKERLRETGNFPYFLLTWQELNENLFEALKLEKVVFFIVMLMMVIVAAFNIVGTLAMILIERRWAMAVFRSVGAEWKRIRRMFRWQGMVIGMAGVVLGIVLALAVSLLLAHFPLSLPAEIYFIDRVPVEISIGAVFLVGAAASIVCWWASGMGLYGMSRINLSRTLSEG